MLYNRLALGGRGGRPWARGSSEDIDVSQNHRMSLRPLPGTPPMYLRSPIQQSNRCRCHFAGTRYKGTESRTSYLGSTEMIDKRDYQLHRLYCTTSRDILSIGLP